MGTGTEDVEAPGRRIVAAEERQRFSDMLLVVTLGWAVYALNDAFVIEQWRNGLVDIAIAAFTFTARLRFQRNQSTRRLLAGTHLVATATLLGILVNCLLLNRNVALGGWFLCMLPLFAAFVAGASAAVVWAVLSGLGALVLWMSGYFLQTPSTWSDPPVTLFFARIVLISVATGLGVASRRASDRRMAEALAAQQAAETARRAAELANQAKSDFLANMSHELRTPLNAVLGFTGTLLMRLPGPLTADQENQLNVIRGSAQHLLSLINDILDLAKIESGKMELHWEMVSGQRALEGVAATLKPLTEKKGLKLLIEVPDESIVLRTDQRALTQIILNLATNAIKFTERGEVTLRLHRPASAGDGRVEFSVSDTGIGIRPEDQQHLFEAFSQFDHMRDGTGLGLHLSQRFAKLIDGTIEFESEYGKGSRFTLRVQGKPER